LLIQSNLRQQTLNGDIVAILLLRSVIVKENLAHMDALPLLLLSLFT